MKFSKKLLISLVAVAVLTSATPAFAASGGRISGSSFRSSRSSGSSYSRSYTPRNSYVPSAPRRYSSPSVPRTVEPVTPRSYSPSIPLVPSPSIPYSRSRRDYDDYYRRPVGGSSIIILPSTPVATPVPVVPTPSAKVTEAVKQPSTPSTAPQKSIDPEDKKSGSNLLAWLLLFAGIGSLTYFILSSKKGKEDTSTLAHIRVALLGSAKDIQLDLARMAELGDTETPEGLSEILKETTLALMRHPELVVYAYGETCKSSPESLEEIFERKSMEERSKVSEELVVNSSGKVRRSSPLTSKSDKNEYILVSIVVATDSNLEVINPSGWEGVRNNLVSLGSIPSEELLALEIIWQPDCSDVLTQEELLSIYPNLVKI